MMQLRSSSTIFPMTTPTFSCSWASMVGVQAPNVSSRLSAGPRATISSSRPFAHGPDRRTRTASVSTRRSRTYRTLFSVRSTARSPSASIAHHRVTRRFCFTEERFPRLEAEFGVFVKARKAGRAHRLRLAGVTLGIAGCDSPADKKVWRDELLLSPGDVPRGCAFAPETLVVENDAVVALARAANGAAGEAPCSSRAQARSRSRYRTRGNARERWDSVRRSVIRARAITSERKRSPRRRGLWTDVARSEGKRQTSTTPTTRKTRRREGEASRAPC